jgi:hypothetical protein
MLLFLLSRQKYDEVHQCVSIYNDIWYVSVVTRIVNMYKQHAVTNSRIRISMNGDLNRTNLETFPDNAISIDFFPASLLIVPFRSVNRWPE